jgi:glycosyltransferase involved in cell wall biosynthesis
MRLAYIIPSLKNPSGWRSHATSFLYAIRSLVEPVLYVAEEDYPEAEILFAGWDIVRLPATQRAAAGSANGASRLFNCYWHIQRSRLPQVDLVHSLEAYPTGMVGHWLAQKLGKPHVITIHGTYGVIWRERRIDRPLYQAVLRRARMICPVSYGTGRLLQENFAPALRSTQIKPILNGNDYWKRVPRSQALDRRIPETPTILSVGDVKPRKGYHICLESYAIVRSSLPGVRYYIAGQVRQNSYFARLQQTVTEHRLEGITFLGALPAAELSRFYQESSVFFLAPQQEGLQFEGFGLVFLEAGAYGLPVVATRTGGVPEAVLDGKTGLLAEPGDSQGLAQALLHLLKEPELARELGCANRYHAESLTWERNAAEQFQAYQEALATA